MPERKNGDPSQSAPPALSSELVIPEHKKGGLSHSAGNAHGPP
jgi:hypothetical protein